MPSANIFALERNSLDSPRPGVALDPAFRRGQVPVRAALTPDARS